MGQNKAFLTVNSRSFIEEMLEKFKGYDERIIVANDVSLYQFQDVLTLQDIYPNRGPLCGLYTAMKHMTGKRAVVVTVDTPLLTRPLLDYLWSLAEGVDCVIPVVDGRHQSLCAVYNVSALPLVEEAVERDERKVRVLLDRLNIKEITESELSQFGDVSVLFSNVNTPDDYKKIKD